MNAVIATLGTALGLSSIFIGFSPAVLAQQRLQPAPQNSETTLSGDSLRSVEDRTLDSDYQNLTSKTNRQRHRSGSSASARTLAILNEFI
jgi:hypothetical protein